MLTQMLQAHQEVYDLPYLATEFMVREGAQPRLGCFHPPKKLTPPVMAA
jgi:hypothetical protein